MLKYLTALTKLTLLASLPVFALISCSKAQEPITRFTPVGEEREIRGMATEAKLTACGPEPGKAGTCEGTLVVQPSATGATSVAVEINRDVALKKGNQAVFLPQLRGSSVVVKYRATKEGPNLATSVVGQ